MSLDIKTLLEKCIEQTKRSNADLVLRLKMEYGTKWSEELRRIEIDQQQKDSEKYD